MINTQSRQFSPNRNMFTVKAAIAVMTMLAMPAAQAGDVRLYVLAPQPPASLQTVETQGSDKPAYAHSYDISYNTVEQQIRNEIKKANIDLGGAVVCEGACPDVHWHVNVSNDFSFTLKNQPVVTAFGNAQDNGVDVYLKTQFKLHTVVSARLWADRPPDTSKARPMFRSTSSSAWRRPPSSRSGRRSSRSAAIANRPSFRRRLA